jgi:DNA-binding IclR family transcriptional regulator
MPRKPLSPSIADINGAPEGVAAVDRAVALLGSFKPGDGLLTLTVLSQRTGLYKSTVLRLLASLQQARLIQRDTETNRYALGPEIARLHGIYSESFSLGTVVMQTLKTLVAQTGESASFHVLKKQGPSFVRLCLFRVDSTHSLRDHVKAGDILPSDRGVGARVLIAFGDRDLAKGASSKEKALYKNIREDGYVALIGDRDPDLAGISAPVFTAAGSLVGAVTLTIPTHRYKTDHIHCVLEAARDLCARI